jgi:hypothetical protein
MNTNRSLLNRAAVRDFTLATLASRRPHLAQKFSRVAGSYYNGIEGWIRYKIEDAVDRIPSNGKTIK